VNKLDNAVIIGFFGALISSLATAIVSRCLKDIKLSKKKILIFFFGTLVCSVVIGLLILYSLYNGTEKRISAALPSWAGFEEKIYSDVGLGFLVPEHWKTNDAVQRVGGGEIFLVRDSDPRTGRAIQGLTLKFENVRPVYRNDEKKEVDNQLKILQRYDLKAQVKDCSIASYNAKEFYYTYTVGGMNVPVKFICVRLMPHVSLQIGVVSELKKVERYAFDEDVRKILDSIVLDKIKISEYQQRLQ
jgi:hypothetical protein